MEGHIRLALRYSQCFICDVVLHEPQSGDTLTTLARLLHSVHSAISTDSSVTNKRTPTVQDATEITTHSECQQFGSIW